MSEDLFKIGKFGRRTIFGGVFLAFMCVVLYFGEGLAHLVGENFLPYVLLAIILAAIAVVNGFLFPRCPENLVIPIGIVGWIITFSFLCWYFWYGPASG